jgi:hypothetical protein
MTTDHTGRMLEFIGLGCFVSPRRFADSTPSRDILVRSVQSLRVLWQADEVELRLRELVDYMASEG